MIESMVTLLWSIYRQPLDRILFMVLLMVAFWGYMGTKNRIRKLWVALNTVVFAGIVAVILYMTVFQRSESSNEVILIPFHSFPEARSQPEMYRSMLMNVFLFVPLGLSMPNILPRKMHPVILTLVFAFLLSVCIEYLQYRYGLGRCEVDDVIMNTVGAGIGSLADIISNTAFKRGRD